MFERVITPELVYSSYEEARRHKNKSVSHLKFRENLSLNLYNLYNDIVTVNYEIGPSICFIVTKPKPREVFAADFRDRIVHHIVMHFLMPVFERRFIRNSFSCMAGRGTLDGIKHLGGAMERHKGGYVAKFDISGFFMHIDKNILLNKLNNLIGEEFYYDLELRELLLYLIRKIVLHHPEENCIIHGNKNLWNLIPDEKTLFKIPKDKGMAIGNLTSQLFAGYYLNDFDHVITDIFGDDYGRYVDDFYIVADNVEEITSRISMMEDYLYDNLGLTLHPKKRYIQPVFHGCKFLGSVYKQGRLYTGNGTLNNFYNKMYVINNFFDTDKVEDILRVRSSINSYLGFMKNYNEYDLRVKMLDLLDEKWFKYFHINPYYSKIVLKKEYRCFRYLL